MLSAGTAHTAACPAANQIVTGINMIASAAGALNDQLSALTISSSPGDIQSAAQSTAVGLSTISNDFNTDTTALGWCQAASPADAQAAADALSSMTRVTQARLATVIGKHSIFAQLGLTAPITSSLRTLEAAADSCTYALLAVAPSEQDAIASGKDQLGNAVGGTVTLYSQVCIPSPLYPTV